ncbi:MAG: DUF2341 domain-containing protein [Candidatus Thermoplasmatota archaeon]
MIKKIKKNETKSKVYAVMIFFLFVSAAFIQASVELADASGGGFEWKDDFVGWSKIDRNLSYNIKKTGDDEIVMKNTYKAWHYPWPKMKKIDIQNNGSSKSEYVIPLEVYHTPSMENDYSDLRFVNLYDENIYELEYWVGDYDQYKADVWVRITPSVPPGNSSIFMFYGDPNAPDHSNFDIVFKWDDRTSPDIMTSYKNYQEGAWDPDVSYGGGRFLVTWEERLGPEDIDWPVEEYERSRYCDIRGRTYNTDGGDPNPPSENDEDIEIMTNPDYHGQDPSVASDGNKYFVVWEQNPTTLANRLEIDIEGAIVTTSGGVTPLSSSICDADDIQEDACVAYSDGRYLVVWEDRRLGVSNYNIWGRYYNSNGNPLTDEFKITSGANYEGQPWICGDEDGFFVVIYEYGNDPEKGAFGLKAKKLDSQGTQIWTTEIVEGNSDKDNVWPAINYNSKTDQYFVTWNDGDLSNDQPRGNIWGNFLNQDGSLVLNNFKIQSGNSYVRTDVVPYMDKMFFVSYDKSHEVWGKLVYNKNGNVITTSEQPLSDGSSENLDWNNLAVSNDGRIFPVWEDERDQTSEYADAFGSVWHIYKTTGSPLMSYKFGYEEELFTEAALYSKILDVDDLQVEKWQNFLATYDSGMIGKTQFFILNSNGGVLHTGLGDISNLPVENVRLKAEFTRNVASDTPVVDKWGVEYIGVDEIPPWTEFHTNPEKPDGNNEWYTKAVDVELTAYDNGSGIQEIYYIIDGGTEHSTSQNPCEFSIRETGEHKIEYWSVDVAGNIEPHNFKNVKIDGRNPKVDITKPEDYNTESGEIKVEFNIEEEGSGFSHAKLYLNNNPNPSKEWDSEQSTYTYTFNAGVNERYDIEVKAWDKAGNMGNDFKSIKTEGGTNLYYSPKIGYLYTINGAQKSPILLLISSSLVLTDKLNVRVKPSNVEGEIEYTEIILNTIVRNIEEKGIDNTADSQGYYHYLCSPRTGIYTIKCKYFNSNDEKIDSFEFPGYTIYVNTL